MSATQRRFLHALGMCALAAGLGVTLGSGFHLVHDRTLQATKLHALLGFSAGGAMAVHVALRRRWLSSVLRRFPDLRGEARKTFVLGALLAVAVALEVVSGALLEPGSAWQGLHHLSSKLVLALAVWHVVRHRGWLKLRLAPWAARRGDEKPVLEAGASR